MTKYNLTRIAASDGSDIPARQSYTAAEREAVHAEKRRLAARASYGADWDGEADNDNERWPLATSLIREGNNELLKAAMAYRKAYTEAHSSAVLGGRGVSMKDGFALDRFSTLNANGTVSYNRPRQKKGAEIDIPAKRYTSPPKSDDIDLYSNNPSVATVPIVKNWTNVPKPWNGDLTVNNMLDAQKKLVKLRKTLGVMAEPLEMSVVDGATYQEVGNSIGVADRSGSIAAGRAVIHMALLAVRDAIGNVRRGDLAA